MVGAEDSAVRRPARRRTHTWCASGVLNLDHGSLSYPMDRAAVANLGPWVLAPRVLWLYFVWVFYLCRLRAPTQKGQVVERRPKDYDCYDI